MNDENTKTILLIEDDDDHAEIIQYYITEHSADIKVIWLKDGEMALEYMRGDFSNKLYPWLIILDLNLPKYDGHEVLSQFKQMHNIRNIPIVVLTTSATDNDINKALSANANSYILKPIEVKQFDTVISQIIGYWSLNRRSLTKVG